MSHSPANTVRRGWRSFHCVDCGLDFELATRDCFSSSSEDCPECGVACHPRGNFVDSTLVVDKMGNLLRVDRAARLVIRGRDAS